MTNADVVEIDSFTDDSDSDFYDRLVEAGIVGVLVKVSQGDRWVLRDAPEKVNRATAAGLHVGALHYMEPSRATVEAERAHFVGNLPPGSYALGLVVELDDLGGRQAYEISPELERMIEALRTAGYVAGVRLASELASQLVGTPWGARLWLDGEAQPGQARPFATYLGKESYALGLPALAAYELVSARMLNAGDTGGRVSAQEDVEPSEDPTDEPDGPGPAASPGLGTESVPPETETETETETESDEDEAHEAHEAETTGLADARANALANL